MMTKEGSTETVNFMIPGAGVLVLGRGNVSHIVNMHCLLRYQYTAHLLLLYKGIIILLSSRFVIFHLVYDGAVDMQI